MTRSKAMWRKPKRGSSIKYPLKGEITRSQAVSTYGPGGIFELRQSTRKGNFVNSVMVMGIDKWAPDESQVVTEPALARSLGVRKFLAPPPVPDNQEFWQTPQHSIKSSRFPKWLVCSKCQRLGEIGRQFRDEGTQPKCAAATCRGQGIPVRLVSACFPKEGDATQPGHIDEFPWVWWAHSYSPNGNCNAPQLRLRNTGDSVGLAGLKVTCESSECKDRGVGRTLQDVFGANALAGNPNGCEGTRPWLGDSEPDCGRPIRALMRGASNVYFPVTASALSIPPLSGKLVRLVGQANDTILTMWIEGNRDKAIAYFRKGQPAAKKFTNEQIQSAFAAVHDLQDQIVLTESEQRAGERTAIIEGRRDEDDDIEDFESSPVDATVVAQTFEGHLSCLVQVNRLREVRALRGFTRIKRPVGGNAYDQECAPIYNSDPGWLPAVEVRGEGIYFELNRDSLVAWQETPGVHRRIDIMHENLRKSAVAEGIAFKKEDLPLPSFVALHTLTHMVINQLSLTCGYSSASLRERLYADEQGLYCGALIYTSAAGADGTLGGLVRQGKPDNFLGIIRSALYDARWCSSDPLCIESTGQGPSGVNLAACHACALVSETSCEHANMMLDRGLVIGVPGSRDVGFLSNAFIVTD